MTYSSDDDRDLEDYCEFCGYYLCVCWDYDYSDHSDYSEEEDTDYIVADMVPAPEDADW